MLFNSIYFLWISLTVSKKAPPDPPPAPRPFVYSSCVAFSHYVFSLHLSLLHWQLNVQSISLNQSATVNTMPTQGKTLG